MAAGGRSAPTYRPHRPTAPRHADYLDFYGGDFGKLADITAKE